jgi:hypothetical protein
MQALDMMDVDLPNAISVEIRHSSANAEADGGLAAMREMDQAMEELVDHFSSRTVQEWERGAKKPSGPARTLLRAIKADPEGLRKALACA